MGKVVRKFSQQGARFKKLESTVLAYIPNV